MPVINLLKAIQALADQYTEHRQTTVYTRELSVHVQQLTDLGRQFYRGYPAIVVAAALLGFPDDPDGRIYADTRRDVLARAFGDSSVKLALAAHGIRCSRYRATPASPIVGAVAALDLYQWLSGELWGALDHTSGNAERTAYWDSRRESIVDQLGPLRNWAEQAALALVHPELISLVLTRLSEFDVAWLLWSRAQERRESARAALQRLADGPSQP